MIILTALPTVIDTTFIKSSDGILPSEPLKSKSYSVSLILRNDEQWFRLFRRL